jgi:hypothetical protein
MEPIKKELGESLTCYNNLPLSGNEVAPPLKIGQTYPLKQIYTCKCGQEHYDVGLTSNYQWVTCYKCKQPIPKGDQIHWCWPLRFEKSLI